MKDELEKLVTSNTDAFDVYEPPGNLWNKIDKELRPKKKQHIAGYSIAAGIVLLLGIFIGFMHQPAKKVEYAANVSAVSNLEVSDAEAYYTSMVTTRRSQMNKFGKDFPDLFHDFDHEMDTLNAIYNQLKTEYVKSNGNPAVLKALIANLQLQAQLATRQLQIIQQIQQQAAKTPHSNTI